MCTFHNVFAVIGHAYVAAAAAILGLVYPGLRLLFDIPFCHSRVYKLKEMQAFIYRFPPIQMISFKEVKFYCR